VHSVLIALDTGAHALGISYVEEITRRVAQSTNSRILCNCPPFRASQC